jgi:hypothetical protein
MATLQANVKLRPAIDYRISYLNHITKYWKSWQDVTGIVALKKIAELRKIELSYIQPRDTNFAVTLIPDVVLLPKDALEPVPEGGDLRPKASLPPSPAGRFRLTAAGFRIRR